MKKSEKKRLEKQLKLQKQAEADRYLARVRGDENKALKKRLETCLEGVAQLSRVMDAVLLEVALKFGEEQDGEHCVTLPKANLDRAKGYEVSTRMVEGDECVICARKLEAEHETDDQGDAAGAE